MTTEFVDLEDESDKDFYGGNDANCSVDKPDAVHLKCLREKFGHTNFRPMQWAIISSIIKNKQDNCVVMSTGYGKSLCYQFPSVFLGTVTLVISPLISLMEDQVLSLKVSNIKACFLGTAQQDNSVFESVINFEYTLVYATPEYISGCLGAKLIKELRSKLSLIAIDEAHCISKWGHDFRPAFRNLNFIRSIAPEVPILAVTATATEQVIDDIVSMLHLRNPQKLCTGFDRPNLEFNVRLKGNQGVWSDIGSILRSVDHGSTIIYCLTRADTESIAQEIKANGINCIAYHAGLSIKQRKSVHEKFVRDEIQVIAATIAFGMGIDKPDVRLVIHYGMPKDIESYYQEVGRAGRDGMPAKCFMFHSRQDFNIHRALREASTKSNILIQNLEELSKRMQEYVNSTECRRLFILKYFEGSNVTVIKRKNCCDNCRSDNSATRMFEKYQDLDENGLFDFTKDAELLLQAIKVFNGHKGLNVSILLLRGSKDQKLGQKYYSNPLYGAGKTKSDDWYKSLANLLEINDYLKKTTVKNQYSKMLLKYHTINLTPKGISWLQNPNRMPIKLKPQQDMLRFLKHKKPAFLYIDSSPTSKLLLQNKQIGEFQISQNSENSFQDLVKSLIKVRAILANRLDVMPYMKASNK